MGRLACDGDGHHCAVLTAAGRYFLPLVVTCADGAWLPPSTHWCGADALACTAARLRFLL